MNLEPNKENIFWRITSLRKFWLIFWGVLNATIITVGIIRPNNTNGFLEYVIVSIITVLGFPFGGFYLLGPPLNKIPNYIATSNPVFALSVSLFSYALIFYLISYGAKHKKYFRVAIIILLLFFIASFAGCTKEVNFSYT